RPSRSSHGTTTSCARPYPPRRRSGRFPKADARSSNSRRRSGACHATGSEKEMRTKQLWIAAALFAAGAAQAQISDGVVKIGVLNDMSSLYAEGAGQGSVVAARMAIEDFRKTADAKGLKVELVFADNQN